MDRIALVTDEYVLLDEREECMNKSGDGSRAVG